MRSNLGALGLSMVLVAACGGPTPSVSSPSPPPSSAGSASPATTAAMPSASLVPTPQPLPSIAASPSGPAASGPAVGWDRTGSIPTDTIRGMVGFSGGYVAITGTRSTWFSADGRTWSSAELPFAATTDPTGNTLDANTIDITTDGKRVLVVGGYAHAPCLSAAAGATGGGPACPSAPLAWISTNGRTWQSAYPGPLPADAPGSTQGSEFDAAWPVPTGGWDAALSFWNGERLAGRDLWHSPDGISWTPARIRPRAHGAQGRSSALGPCGGRRPDRPAPALAGLDRLLRHPSIGRGELGRHPGELARRPSLDRTARVSREERGGARGRRTTSARGDPLGPCRRQRLHQRPGRETHRLDLGRPRHLDGDGAAGPARIARLERLVPHPGPSPLRGGRILVRWRELRPRDVGQRRWSGLDAPRVARGARPAVRAALDRRRAGWCGRDRRWPRGRDGRLDASLADDPRSRRLPPSASLGAAVGVVGR